MAFIRVDSSNSLIIEDCFDERKAVSDIGGYWDAIDRVWRVTFTVYNLNYLLDNLTNPSVEEGMDKMVEAQIEREKTLARIKAMSKQDVPVRAKISGLKLPMYNYQKLGVMFATMNGFGALVADEMGLGKAQPLDAKILTPSGWKRMGDICIGDVVFGVNGKTCIVKQIHPQGIGRTYRIKFSDESSTECSEDHLWAVNTPARKYRGKDFMILTTKDIIRRGLTRKNGKNGTRSNWYIPMAGPMELCSPDSKILHPYVMGVLLGDGGISCGRMNVHVDADDHEIARRINTLLPKGLTIKKQRSKGKGYLISQSVGSNTTHKAALYLKNIGLLGKRSYEKFIPDDYLFDSAKNRLELLRGLMDTDGTVGRCKRGNVASFCTTSKKIRDGVIFLVQSLGGTTSALVKHTFYTKNGRKHRCRNAFIMNMSLPSGVIPFHLPRKYRLYPNLRKKYKPTRAIVEIKDVGRKSMQCITVSANDGLYITDDFIVTHNSVQSIATAVHLKSQGKVSKALIIVPASLKFNWPIEIEKFTDEKYVVIDGTPDERIVQWLRDDVFFYIVNYELITEDLFGGRELKEKENETPNQKHKREMRIAKAKQRERILSSVRTRMWDFIAIDEAHYIKSCSSRRSRSVKSLRAKFRMALTGTPMDGRLEELHSVMGFVAPGLLGSKSRFYQRHVETDFWGRVTGYKRLSEVSKRIEPFFIRRLKRDVLKDLPDKIYENKIITLSPEERKIYNKLANGGHEATEDEQAIVACIRCKQFCNWPPKIDEGCATTTKMDVLKEVLDEVVVQNGHKALIFTQYKEMLNVIADTVAGMGLKYLRIDGDTPKEERAKMQKIFNEDTVTDLMIGTEAMSLGLTLIGADHVIMYDHNWSPSIMSQRADRAHRIGQKNVVTVVGFTCKDTIEERILEVLENKNKITAEVLGDQTDEVVLKRMNPREIAKLL